MQGASEFLLIIQLHSWFASYTGPMTIYTNFFNILSNSVVPYLGSYVRYMNFALKHLM